MRKVTSDSEVIKHTNKQVYKHKQTLKHTDRHTQTHTQTHTHIYTHTHKHISAILIITPFTSCIPMEQT